MKKSKLIKHPCYSVAIVRQRADLLWEGYRAVTGEVLTGARPSRGGAIAECGIPVARIVPRHLSIVIHDKAAESLSTAGLPKGVSICNI